MELDLLDLTEKINDHLLTSDESNKFVTIYNELKNLSKIKLHQHPKSSTISPTTLVHESYMKIFKSDSTHQFKNRLEFYSLASKVFRSIIVDYARRKSCQKRPQSFLGVTLKEEQFENAQSNVEKTVFFDIALSKLEAKNEYYAKLIEMKFYTGLQLEEIADIYQCSSRTIRRDINKAKNILRKHFE